MNLTAPSAAVLQLCAVMLFGKSGDLKNISVPVTWQMRTTVHFLLLHFSASLILPLFPHYTPAIVV